MAVADSRGSLDDACAADKSRHFVSNGSSEPHGVEQMPAVGAFVRRPLRMVPVGWRLADEPHVVASPGPTTVDVCVSSAAARAADGCRPDAVERDGRSDADSCWSASPGSPAAGSALRDASATTARAWPFPFRSRRFVATTEWCWWSCLRWACGVA